MLSVRAARRHAKNALHYVSFFQASEKSKT
jgi:hypothetical protein